jgi:hypothetical protein
LIKLAVATGGEVDAVADALKAGQGKIKALEAARVRATAPRADAGKVGREIAAAATARLQRLREALNGPDAREALHALFPHGLTLNRASDGANAFLVAGEGEIIGRTLVSDPYRMRTDNGPPFASVGPGGLTELSVWWIKFGIVPERIEPGCPQQNGCHERMHRTLKQEATVPPGETLPEQQRLLDRFRREFNEQRPHEALGQTVPAKHYAVSQRRMPKELEVPAYRDMETRWVGKSGGIKWQGEDVHVGRCLVGEPVGLEQVGPGRWQVRYGPVSLGMLREGKEPMRLEAMPRKEEPELEEPGTQ